jgi:hypothetical protein
LIGELLFLVNMSGKAVNARNVVYKDIRMLTGAIRASVVSVGPQASTSGTFFQLSRGGLQTKG